jgi:hypothetical protein
MKARTKAAIHFFAFLLLSISAWASTELGTFQFTGTGSANQGGVFVYPYLINVSGRTSFDGNYLVACNSFGNHIFTGEIWSGTLNTYADLSATKYGPQNFLKYDAAVWLMQQMYAHPESVGDINFAVWNLFQDVASEPGYTAGAAAYFQQAVLPLNYSTVNRDNVLIFTPTEFDRSNPASGPQELFAWLPYPAVNLPDGNNMGGQPLQGTPVPTPEPAALVFFATGLLGGAKLLRSRFAA